MTYTTEMPIAGRASSGWRALALWCRSRGAKRPEDTDTYLEVLHALCERYNLDWRILATQAIHETTDPGTGAPFASKWWIERLNPAGIGITGDPAQNAASRVFADGQEAALAHVTHMWGYVNGASLPAGLTPALDPRWRNLLDAGWAGIVSTIDDLTGRWAADGRYAEKIVRRMHELERYLEAEELTTPEEPNDMAVTKRWRIFLVSGHRQTTDGGSPTERGFTDDLAEAYTAEARRRGYQADWWQRDLDNDSLPDMTQGTLNTTAIGVAKAIAASSAHMNVMLDLHFDGAVSVVHTIVPDCAGLRAAVGTAPSDDTAANNTLDVALAKAISAKIAGDLGLPNYPARRLGIPGVMSEKDTGVANTYGARLAMFGATAYTRDKCARLVIEHAGYNQTTAKSDWARRCAKAAFDAIDAVYLARNPGGELPGPEPEPDPDPGVTYAEAKPIEALAPFIVAGTVIKAPPPIVANTYVYTPITYIATKATPRLQSAADGAPSIGPDLRAGESFPGAFTFLGPSGWHAVTPWWTVFRLADLTTEPFS